MVGIFESTSSLLLPRYCLLCSRRIRTGILCLRCVPPATHTNDSRCSCCFTHSPSLDDNSVCELCRLYPLRMNSIRFLWDYRHPLRKLLHAMKYRPSPILCKTFGKLLAAKLFETTNFENWDLLISMPSSRSSIIKRGLNQCHLIAKELNKTLQLPYSFQALKYQGSHLSQTQLPHIKRIKNILGGLKVKKNLVKSKRVLLLEDVITTGATTTFATLELLSAGATSVDIVALARASAWQKFRIKLAKYSR